MLTIVSKILFSVLILKFIFKNTWAKEVKICNEGFEIQANKKVEILKMYDKFWGSIIEIFNSEFYNIWPST